MDDIKIPKNNDYPFPPSNPLAEPTLHAMSQPRQPLASRTDTLPPVATPTKQPPKKKRSNPFKKISKKQYILLVGVILIILGGAIYFFINKDSETQTSDQAVTPAAKKDETPPPPTSPLTGRVVASADIAARPVTGIMIENSLDARPQSGLYDADMVFEAIAEGGVTRFMAVYQESRPMSIGPVRSARPYYVDYIAGLDGSYGHVGGSPEALEAIKTLNIKDLDQFYNGSSYTRISSRYAPHNVYTDFDRLDDLNKSKGYTSSKFTPLERKIDVPQTPTAAIINITMSGPKYNPTFSYGAATNSYLRSQAGGAHTDATNSKQINPKVVVALVLPKGNDPDGYHTDYTTTGSGKTLVFQDGIVSEGTWSKTDSKASLVLKDKYGLPMKLNTGQTWITLVGNSSDVTYKAQ